MRPIVSPEEMRAADEGAIASGVPADVLMERAGRAVAGVVLGELGGRYGKKVTVVCGKGNNGGDGFVCARVLAAEGVRVTCCTVFDPNDARGAAKDHLDRWLGSGGQVVPFEERHLWADLIVDAIFGTGFSGEATGVPATAIRAIGHVVLGEQIGYEEDGAHVEPPGWPRPKVVSVDVPSAGIVPAHVTVALGAEKYQTFFAPSDARSRVEVADIGIAVDRSLVQVFEAGDAARRLPRPDPDDHKTSHGSVLVLAGSDTSTGAPVLTARAATRMGAGYVTLASTLAVVETAGTLVPEVLKKVVTEGPVLGPEALDRLQDQLEWADALAIGPGLGTGHDQRRLVERVLAEVDVPVVMDADALNVMAGHPEPMSERTHPLVITPHVAELARMLGCATGDVLKDRMGAAIRAAESFGCAVLLKGRRTLIALPRKPGYHAEGVVAIPVGGPELATAGTGDVLTGVLAALLARSGDPPLDAATAAFCHGVAGEVAATTVGRVGVVAWDVAEALPAAIELIGAPLP